MPSLRGTKQSPISKRLSKVDCHARTSCLLAGTALAMTTNINVKLTMMVIDNKFEIGDTVFLKTDTDQNQRLITGICIAKHSLTYRLSCGTQESWNYDFEISNERDILKTCSN